jgi:Na+/H+ antiporter NhaD/arsenite permease-like protein
VRQPVRFWLLVGLLLGISLALLPLKLSAQNAGSEPGPLIVGRIEDSQQQPVVGAQVILESASKSSPVAETTTQPDGLYSLSLPATIPESLTVHIERAHFKSESVQLDALAIQKLSAGQTVVLPDITLPRQVGPAFWIATVIFLMVLVLIASGAIHNTLSSLIGVAVIFAFSYLGRPLSDTLYILDFPGALRYVDWSVVFLIMGMMIVIAVVEGTGIFQWLAFRAYRVSGGRLWLLLPILMLITGVASAFLDNVTTMLLMTPITIQICLAIGINPLTLLMPALLASNVVGISTLIGTPTNILIGSFAHISFSNFLVELTPGVLLAVVGLVIYSEVVYRRELQAASAENISPLLLQKLSERARITEPEDLKKAGVVGAGMMVLFVSGEHFHLVPAVTALMGATALLLWVRPDIEEMIEAVDWTTLVFFITLFMVVGAVQEVGLISYIATGIGRLVGDNLLVAMLAITWISALLSTVVANIPFTAAMLPVVGFLSAHVPGADSKVLFFCLSVGAAMGGNGSLIGASANMVTAGISERAGYPMTYVYFLRRGFPALLITVGLALAWLFLRFVVLG